MLARLARAALLLTTSRRRCRRRLQRISRSRTSRPRRNKHAAGGDPEADGAPRACSAMRRSWRASSRKRARSRSGSRRPTAATTSSPTYNICKWSGKLGPKYTEGDRQAPEGFYTVRPGADEPELEATIWPSTSAIPNAYDRANGRTGANLMVHGACSSSGCYSMTDAQIEEIYAFGRDAFKGGQTEFQIEAFPFRMTAAQHGALPQRPELHVLADAEGRLRPLRDHQGAAEGRRLREALRLQPHAGGRDATFIADRRLPGVDARRRRSRPPTSPISRPTRRPSTGAIDKATRRRRSRRSSASRKPRSLPTGRASGRAASASRSSRRRCRPTARSS